MALIADDCRDRAEQLIALTERLTALIAQEAQRIRARLPPLEGAEAEEKNRLANAYRLELARIKQEPALIEGAPPLLLAKLRKQTEKLHETLAAHEIELNAVKLITEGLVHAMAEEVARQRGAGGGDGARGAIE
ncbi:MAG: flagellar basal body protein, partial [Phycisphaerales bacterium]|nr:flagellar basal body protein [Hyphomonadaceae bacterium]